MKPSFAEITGPNDHKTHSSLEWERDGVLYLPRFISHHIIDSYIAEREKLIGKTDLWRPGWPDPTPYMRVPSMRRLALFRPLTEAIAMVIDEEPGLHLCLTGFQSTERAWHQDRYLNPEGVGEHYIAVWIALDDVHGDAGPFEYVPGSHKWAVIERQKVWDAHARMGHSIHPQTWPSDTQGWVGEACEAEIAAQSIPVKKFIGKKGDVLLWHASLLHRGSKPKNPALERRALICHYSAISARPDMPKPVREPNGSWYFPF